MDDYRKSELQLAIRIAQQDYMWHVNYSTNARQLRRAKERYDKAVLALDNYLASLALDDYLLEVSRETKELNN